ncbi:AN1-type zinc finger protein 2A isoform X2 [Neophocaena asiaeorientalis asiaeorientalis]|uniref:AN1-type zinc finger protein 2A isoform X2 n=1 Tax=Neophocaena asiaeorientalis asiaeorientalis TaxID=1706337 RepID=A0A341CWX3_NEOAA|nr:AN1-type zinc finger protein 2A isoform X2 [Neophocaena asiaeorientalis asiaeorientalis]
MAGRSWRRDAGLSRGLGPASAVARILFSSSLWPCPPRLTAGRETALGLCHLPLPSAAAQASDEGQGVQVPVCPLCNSPIPVKTGAVPDVVVGEHMDGACKHHPGKKKEKNFRQNWSRHLWSLLHPQLESKETRVGHGPWQLVHSSDWRLSEPCTVSEPCTRPQAQPSTARSLGPPGLFGWFP